MFYQTKNIVRGGPHVARGQDVSQACSNPFQPNSKTLKGKLKNSIPSIKFDSLCEEAFSKYLKSIF